METLLTLILIQAVLALFVGEKMSSAGFSIYVKGFSLYW